MLALGLAARHPGVPWMARLLAATAAAYALSPIDLIPDFIPVLGYLDDLIIVPILIWLAVRAIPDETMAELRARAGDLLARPGRGRLVAAAIVIALWTAAAGALLWWLYRVARG